MQPSAPLESASEIGEKVGVAADTIRLWARRGWIPAVRISTKVVRFEWTAVLAALRERGAVRQQGDAR